MDDVSKYGMKWEFAESHYTAGDNKTSESAHIYLKDNHVIACTVDANGKPQPGNQDRSTLERRPMVRVTLVDTTKTTNNIVAVGFIKFRITEKEAEPADAINIDFDGNGYDLSCTDYNFTQTWAQVENKVLSQLNMSKEEFEKNYTVEKISGSQTNCQLYAHDAQGKPFSLPSTEQLPRRLMTRITRLPSFHGISRQLKSMQQYGMQPRASISLALISRLVLSLFLPTS